jgi:hypothetical protein
MHAVPIIRSEPKLGDPSAPIARHINLVKVPAQPWTTALPRSFDIRRAELRGSDNLGAFHLFLVTTCLICRKAVRELPPLSILRHVLQTRTLCSTYMGVSTTTCPITSQPCLNYEASTDPR